jgi:hypothetical protein
MGLSRGHRSAIGLAVLSLALASCGGGSGGGAPGAAGGAASAPGTSQGGATPAFLAGAAAVDATPPPGGPLAGFGAPPRREINALTIPLQIAAVFGACFDPDPSDERTFFGRSQGTLDPIMARALVLSNGTTKAAIVKIDAIASSRDLHDELVAAAQPLGIPPENVLLCATHTHSGPGAISHFRIWQVIAADCFNQQSYDRMRDAAVKALRDADAALRPAEIGMGKTTCTDASRNRRGRPGIYDPEVGILKVTEKGSGAPIAAAVNFAVHGTALGGSNMLYSADVMGVCERRIESQLGGGVAIFLNGAEGDVSPDGGMAAGDKIGDAFVSAWPAVAVKDWVEIRGAKTIVPLPHPVVQTGCIPIPGGNRTSCDFIPGLSISVRIDDDWVPKEAPFQALRIDRSVLATIPGEPITEIGWDVKRRATLKGFDQGFVVGLANEHISYITNLAEYVRGEYEGASTIYGPGTGDLVVNSCDAVMDQVKP